MDYRENLHKCREYITALEDEKRKIEMFQRELPLCLELVSQAIENYKQQLVGITTTATTTFSPATVAGPTTTTDQCFNGQSECSEQTTSDCPPPVLEEFMPIRRPTSNSTDEEEEGSYNHHHDELESRHNNNSKRLDNDLQTGTSVKKVDWLRSVQLWNPTVSSDPPHMEENRNLNYQHPRKVQVVEVKTSGSGGAFHPFQKVQNISGSSVVQHQSHHVVKPAVIIPTTTASITPAISVGTPSTTTRPSNAQANIASSSCERTAAAPVCGSTVAASNKKEEGSSSKDGSGGNSASRKARRCWSPELHKKFLNALQQLGGSHVATPKQIRELMKVDGLTNDEVKSHLQKYRLHTRRISPTIHHHHNNSNTQQPPQFVVVGGIWVPSPTEYAAAVAQPEDPISSFHPHTAVSTAGSAPPLSVSTSHHHPNQNQSTTLTTVRNSMRSEEEEEERGSRSRLSSGHSNGRCNSPATSSSTHTTTTSPAAAQAH